MSSAHPSCDFDLYTVEYVFERVIFCMQLKCAATGVRGFSALLAGNSSTCLAALETCE